jgi:endonuclease/exonuclease/phosphatase family metal-dependent hydrolase
MINRLAKQILLFFNALVIVFLLLGFAGGKISPTLLPGLAIFALFFHIMVFVNLGFIIFWLAFQKYYFIFSLLALLLVYKPLLETFHLIPPRETKQFNTTFSVLSYNVKVFDLYNWRKNKQSLGEFYRFIRTVSPDIACFQEYFTSTNGTFPVHDSLMQNQGFTHAHIAFSSQLNNGHNFGIATYSRFPIINKNDIHFPNTHNMAIVTDVKIEDDTLRIINCHLESVKFLKEDYIFIDSLPVLNDKARIKGAKGVMHRLKNASQIRAVQTREIIRMMDESPYPIMLCGDFNDVPASYTYQSLSKGFTDSFKQFYIGMGGTFPRFFPALRIDYILFQEPLQCTHFALFRNNLSDHYPVYGIYTLP